MLTSDDLRFLLVLARSPSFAAAAREIAVTPAAVTQRLRAIEGRLHVRLFHRGPRGVSLTDEGSVLCDRSSSILIALDALATELVDRSGHVSGHLRIAASRGFGRRYVAPAVLRYRHAFPDVRITLELSDNPTRLKPASWDVIIHIGNLPDMDLQVVTLAPNKRLLCCAPAYAERYVLPSHPAALVEHMCLALVENDEDVTLWQLRSTLGETSTVRIPSAMMSNDGEVIREWALAGCGIMLRSEWHVADDIAAGRLVQLLPDWAVADAPVVALLDSRHGRPARTQKFVELLSAHLHPAPWRRV